MLTVGIDLGTSTTQLVLSELTVENFASVFTVPRISISEKKVVYRSEIIFTPLINQTEIADEPIKRFVTEEYQKAGIKKTDIQMGAVIITGETARKTNASKVLEALSGFAGDFVVATAGPDLESIIAGKGAGTQQLSKEHKGAVANIDIGGGTSNLAVFKDGDTADTACFDIGGRLIKLDPKTMVVTYIAPKIQEIVATLKLPITLQQKVTVADLEKVVQELVLVLENSVGIGGKSQFYDLLVTNHGLKLEKEIISLTFSGGVADCLAENLSDNLFEYGDIGKLLGYHLRHSRLFTEKQVLHSLETIRATVVGAGSHTAEVSGSTIAYTEEILPIKNLPILKIAKQDETLAANEMAQTIQEKLNWYRLEENTPQIVLAIEGLKNPKFSDIQRYAEGIVNGLQDLVKEKIPLIVSVKEDMAKALGHSIFAHLPQDYPFVCIDSIVVENGDYIDIGQPVAEGAVLPVIVKTLVFN
ncbi:MULTISPECIES: ethanolamine ammonia-lyase reactivating factor EutA [unclassified Enterococcus]|uniref:ethanolamine ammonia-lyase reactivating factor EutA n=1 Tax=unclassified Enterococcus TaxID=2608891 RepID=UPI0024746749|nr:MULTISPECIES: ethanolamine ammonia-lyase reactivating factor EutA [unclassified Enterococcus]